MSYRELIAKLKDLEAIAYGYHINGKVLGLDCCEFEQIMADAADSIGHLVSRCSYLEETIVRTNEECVRWDAKAKKAERERDAAIFDLIRAEYAAKETCRLLDNEIYPVCDYSVYLAAHDSVSDIVNWEQDNVWRGKKEE